MDLKQKFEEDKGFDVYAYRQEYAGASVNKDGFNDDYVEWLENKVKILSLSGVSQRSELLKAFLKNADDKGNIVLIESEQKCIEDFSLSFTDSDEEYEPYFGWCNVEGCENEGANVGCCWRETGYWTVCSKHASEYRAGKPQPKMQQKYIDKEATRLPDGTLPIVNEG